MRRVLLVVMTCLGVVCGGAGCQLGTQPRVVARWSPHGQAKIGAAPYAGGFSLLPATRGSRGQWEPAGAALLVRSLRRGQPVGFARVDGGGVDGVEAVAGDDRLSLPHGSYLWRVEPDPQQWDSAASLLVVVVATAVLIAIVAGAGDFDFGRKTPK